MCNFNPPPFCNAIYVGFKPSCSLFPRRNCICFIIHSLAASFLQFILFSLDSLPPLIIVPLFFFLFSEDCCSGSWKADLAGTPGSFFPSSVYTHTLFHNASLIHIGGNVDCQERLPVSAPAAPEAPPTPQWYMGMNGIMKGMLIHNSMETVQNEDIFSEPI